MENRGENLRSELETVITGLPIPSIRQRESGASGRDAPGEAAAIQSARRFRLAQAAGWGLFGLISFLGVLPYVGSSPHVASVSVVFVRKLALASSGLLLSFVLKSLCERLRSRETPFVSLLPPIAGVAFLCSLAATAASNLAGIAFSERFEMGYHGRDIFAGDITTFAVFLAWAAAYMGFLHYEDLRRARELSLEAQALAQEARLETLRYQVQPHFLFNSLNTIQALVEEDSQRASRAVDELAGFLRYSLRKEARARARLREEIENIQSYVAMEKIRFEENLETEIITDVQALDCVIPTLLLHPLVENAIQYGMLTSAMPLRVRIAAVREGNDLRLEVANTGAWAVGSERAGHQLGLANVRKRLEAMFPAQHSVDSRAEDGWVRVTLTIPAENL
jgi:two-component system LytT family sensor kinase